MRARAAGGDSRHFDDFSLEKSVSGQACGCVCVAGRTCECVHKRACVCVASVIGCRCLAHSSASDLVEIWDQRGRSAC